MGVLSQDQAERIIKSLTALAESQLSSFRFIPLFYNGTASRDHMIQQLIEKFETTEALPAMKSVVAKAQIRPFTPFLGMASAKQTLLFGLGSKHDNHVILAFNLSEIEDEKDLRLHVLRAISHALDLHELYKKKGKVSKNYAPILPKTKALARSHASLKADLFAAVFLSLNGEPNAIENLAKKRSEQSLRQKAKFLPEEYPFVIAHEALEFAMQDITRRPAKSQFIQTARDISLEVIQTFELSQIYQWWNFSRPAQDMAWRGFDRDTIINCAATASDDPHVRAIGMMMADLLETETSIGAIDHYNSFIDNDHNRRAHKKAIDELFEDVMDRALQNDDSRALYEAANMQNLGLTDGKIMGWCAHALQAAGRAYDSAKEKGIEALDVVREEFKRTREDIGWENLASLGKAVIKKARSKGMVSLDELQDIAQASTDYSRILDSILVTTNDPEFIKKMELANDPEPAVTANLSREFGPLMPSVGPSIGHDITPNAAPQGPGLGTKASALSQKRLRVVGGQDTEAENDSD